MSLKRTKFCCKYLLTDFSDFLLINFIEKEKLPKSLHLISKMKEKKTIVLNKSALSISLKP